MNDVTFTGSYVVAFLMLWRLVIVAFPFMVLLIIPGLMYGSKLCLKRALAKGMTIGSSEITFAIWSFMARYGSLLVMYHGGQGGTVFVVGASISADCL